MPVLSLPGIQSRLPDGKRQATEARRSWGEGRIQQNEAQGIREGAREAPSRAYSSADLGPSHRGTHHRGLRGSGHSRQGRRDQPDHRPHEPAHLPAAGEIVLFDRSWYNRAGVERVMGFCTEEESERFLLVTPAIEREIVVQNGIILRKYFLDIGQDEQQRRFKARINDPVKHWKLSPMDIESVRPSRGGVPCSPWSHHQTCDSVRNATKESQNDHHGLCSDDLR